ncbi:MAG TPA: universal stress protein [Hellea balneolensis]|uniref:Universal stress protein n=1 Tax=Hellea balneolensis TaxID=287478 RepID=A0A7C3C9S2_9PROT|nr:universal stress protein [Hellea balneolensis]
MSEDSFDEETHEDEGPQRFKILVCIDGSEESHRGLKYAVKLGQGNDADLTLLYVRPIDKGMKSGVHMARQNMLDWGFELPGMRALKKARDQLIELGFLGGDWQEEDVRKRAYGDPIGDTMKTYTSDDGTHIALKLMIAPHVAAGILDECELNHYDLTIIAMSGRGGKNVAGKINWRVTNTVVTEHHGTVLLAREIEENHGHLICVNDEKSIEAAKKDALLASRCQCPVHLFSVAKTEEERPEAEKAIALAKQAIEGEGVEVVTAKTAIGNACERIIEEGKDFSVIVMADSSVKGFRRFFQSSVAYDVLQHAHNSVMIIR